MFSCDMCINKYLLTHSKDIIISMWQYATGINIILPCSYSISCLFIGILDRIYLIKLFFSCMFTIFYVIWNNKTAFLHLCQQQISTLAGNLVPSYFEWEVLFTMAIVGLGLLLFALLIGNMQNFLQALGRRYENPYAISYLSNQNFPLILAHSMDSIDRNVCFLVYMFVYVDNLF